MTKRNTYILLITLAVVGFVGFWFWREAIFSKQILRLEILGPESAKMGEEIEYTVKYKNNGNFALESPKLIFELPDHSLNEDNKIRFTKDLEEIYPGKEDFVTFRARLLGKEGDLKVARVWLSYVPHNLSVRYESDTTFTTKIESVAITLAYDMPLRVEKGKEFTYAINYFSNIDYPLENLSIKVAHTEGFTIKSANPMSLDNSEWKLRSLNKGEGGKIKITGVITADDEQTLNFSAQLGMWRDGVFIVMKDITQEITAVQPLLFISQQINGSSNYVASPGETLRYDIFLRNIGTTPFNNLFLLSRLEGAAYDLSTLQSSEGQVKPNDNLIVFDSKQISALQNLSSQEEVKVSFSVKLKDTWADANSNSAVIKHKVNVFDISQEFETKVNSKLELSQKAYYSTIDGIENTGPIPPEVSKATMYTIQWRVKNYLNNVKNVKVKAVLPREVSLNDMIVPESQASHFSFDSMSREIIWLAGDLTSNSQASLSFQVALTPSQSQRGSLASLIGQATAFAEDQFTKAVSQTSVSGVNTSLPDDQSNSGGGVVK